MHTQHTPLFVKKNSTLTKTIQAYLLPEIFLHTKSSISDKFALKKFWYIKKFLVVIVDSTFATTSK